MYRKQSLISNFLEKEWLESDGKGVESTDLIEVYLESSFTDLETARERIATGFTEIFQVLGH
jgi:hypothetical protein